MSWMKPVFSSMVSEVGWDDSTGELLVTWAKTGRMSAYQGFDEAKAIELSNALSVGQMINSEIKNSGAPHRYRS